MSKNLSESQQKQLERFIEEKVQDLGAEYEREVIVEYVLALLKNEGNTEELKRHCIDELQEFLENGTVPFVNSLFDELTQLTTSKEDDEEDVNESIGSGRSRLDSVDYYSSDEDDDEQNWKRSRRRQHPEDVSSGSTVGTAGAVGRGSGIENRTLPVPNVVDSSNTHVRLPREYGHPNGGGASRPARPPRYRAADRYERPMDYTMYPPRGMLPMEQPPFWPTLGHIPATGYLQQPPMMRPQEPYDPMYAGMGPTPYARPPRGKKPELDFPVPQTSSMDNYQVPITPILKPKESPKRNSSQQLQQHQQQQQLQQQQQQHPQPSPYRGKESRAGKYGTKSESTRSEGAPAAGKPARSKRTSILQIEKIPPELCTIDKLNGHFKKFGNIINITLQPIQQRALIEFSAIQEAQAAHRSPDPILGNRFIRVFFATNQEATTTTTTTGDVAPAPSQITASSTSFPNPNALPFVPPTPALSKKQELQKVKEAIENQKALLRKKNTEERVELMARLEAGKDTLAPQEKERIIERLGELAKIMKAHNEAVKRKSLLEPDTSIKRPKVESPKPPIPTEVLKKEYERLKKEAQAIGIADSQGKFLTQPPVAAAPAAIAAPVAAPMKPAEGLLSSRGRGRGALMATSIRPIGARKGKVDMRARTIVVKGIPEQFRREAIIRAHFHAYGEVESVTLSPSGAVAMVTMGTRFAAEAALKRGTKLANLHPLQLEWFTNTTPSTSSTTADKEEGESQTSNGTEEEAEENAEQSTAAANEVEGRGKSEALELGNTQ